MKVYGPYLRKDGRMHVILYDKETKKRTTQSYPRYLMENYLGRKLLESEHVDHINNDFTDNRIENLQLLTQTENNKKSAKKKEMISFICPICKKESIKEKRFVRWNNLVNKKAGPFCSKSCAGKWSSDKQYGNNKY